MSIQFNIKMSIKPLTCSCKITGIQVVTTSQGSGLEMRDKEKYVVGSSQGSRSKSNATSLVLINGKSK